VYLAAATYIWTRFGRRSVSPIQCQVAAPNFFTSSYWKAYRRALEDEGWKPENAVHFVMENAGDPKDFIPCHDPARFVVNRRTWWRNVLRPGLKLVGAVWEAAVRAPTDRWVVETACRCVNLALVSLSVWRLFHNINCRFYLDIADYTALHNLKAIILRKQGTGVVRIPWSENENPGYWYKNLDYEMFLAGGTYHWQTYGSTWAPDTGALAIGQLRNDRRFIERLETNRKWIEEVEERLAQGKRMIGFFCSNDLPGHIDASLALFDSLWAIVRDEADWFVLIKPKKLRSAGGFLDRLSREAAGGALRTGKIIVADFPDAAGLFPATWVFERMQFGVTTPSSVQVECLATGKPMLSYFPVLQDTTSTQIMRQARLLYDNVLQLQETIKEIVSRGISPEIPRSWFMSAFDPYCDGQALSRIVRCLYADSPGATIAKPTNSSPAKSRDRIYTPDDRDHRCQ
jgi:hypothetical protein